MSCDQINIYDEEDMLKNVDVDVDKLIPNIEYLIIYSLIIAFSLSLNSFFHLILTKLEYKENINAQFIYLTILFVIMILLTYKCDITLKF